ncbi:hypothetical protein GTW43_31890 [Streptomyces sp. SID5785]|uniref:hypothetical protein n=1 Tax=Streptomyces sp. SID5785 TaxID=2690309 RepID=UPI001360DF98|nr:hypothetical protein [Streptomyces sp. SID5785]MZD09648.1 hypothetical protein [Streptomyces sp. SID5785]
MTRTRPRRRRLRRAVVPLGAVALVGLHTTMVLRGHPLPPPNLGGPGRLIRPREVAPLVRVRRVPVRRSPRPRTG